MSSLLAHCYVTSSNDEFTLKITPSNYNSLICELQKSYPKLNNLEITYYDSNFDCNITIIDDDSLNECIESSISDINVKDIDNSIAVESLNSFVKNNSVLLDSNFSGMSFITGSDSILDTYSTEDQATEIDEISKFYESIELVDNQGNGQVYKVKLQFQELAVKIIPTFTSEEIDSIMKGILITKQIEKDQSTKLEELTYSIFTRIVHTKNIYLLKNGNICVESEWMDMDMLSYVKSGKLFDPYEFLKYMMSTLHVFEKHKVIHRNIKPSIIFKYGSSFKISGFEYAKTVEELNRIPFKVVGNLNLLAPEIVEQMYKGKDMKKSPYTTQSDIFSLGVTVYQLLTLDTNTQWSILSIELADEIEFYLRKKITQPMYQNIIPLLTQMLHRKSRERVSLYTARCWLNKVMQNDPMNSETDFAFDISFDDEDLCDFSEPSESLSDTVEKFILSDHALELQDIDFDTLDELNASLDENENELEELDQESD